MVEGTLLSPPLGHAAQQRWLADLHQRFHHRSCVQNDPLHFLYEFSETADREIVGLIAALLAYGNVKAIATGIRNALGRMTQSPYRYLLDSSPLRIANDFQHYRYRMTSGVQLGALLIGVRAMLRQHGSLHIGFANYLRSDHDSILPAACQWVDELAAASAPSSLDHLLPHPSRGSACKRLMLYLRWMVRRDCIDIGAWPQVSASLLVAPVDTHLFTMARRLRWTQRKQANLATAMQITAALRRFSPDDPLRYDFALTRPGIMRVPMRRTSAFEQARNALR